MEFDFSDLERPTQHAEGTIELLDFRTGIRWSELEALSLWDPGTPEHEEWVAAAKSKIAELGVALAPESPGLIGL